MNTITNVPMNTSFSSHESGSPTWPEFLEQLAAERKRSGEVRPVRALTEEFTRSTLALLFPQFVSANPQSDTRVEAIAHRVRAGLLDIIGPIVPEPETVVDAFFAGLPATHAMLMKDVAAIHACDPAAESQDEVIVAYPGFLAIAVHRMAHQLYELDVPIIPRLMSEWAHRETGIDMHPGAVIGASFAIDHGTGIVIGETTTIGDRVRIYQGVTLGALAVSKRLANRKRHPTIGSDVVIYANATILGGNTTVGDHSVIGGNVWLTSSVPVRSVVQFTSTVEQRPSDDGIEFHI